MDDEDGEPGNMETWNLHNSAPNDSISIKETLMRANGSQQHPDNIDDPKEKKDWPIQQQKAKLPNALPQIVSCVPYKGYKKRILAQTQENDVKGEVVRPKFTSKERRLELPKRGNKIAEYAQYLGLQPSTKFLGRNGPRPNCALPMGPGPSSDCLPAPNFNRKVYLCSGCNTYFENWHLFLHMRDVHERHICLFCLGLFDQVERLSHHLSKNHSIPESEYTSVEDFQRIFRGPCYLICCSCEKVFTESDNFYNHYCAGSKQSSKQASNICSVCKQVDTHLRTCSMAPDTEDELSPTTAREISRKMSRINRVKQAKVRRSLGGFDTAKPKPVTDKAESTDVNVPGGENERVGNSMRDTVAETIMEVSRCTDTDATEEEFREEEKSEPMEIDEGVKIAEPEKDVTLDDKTNVDAEENNEAAIPMVAEEQNKTENDVVELTNHVETNAESISINGELPIVDDTRPEEPVEKLNSLKKDDFPEISQTEAEVEKVNGDCSFSSSRSSSPTNPEHSVFSPSVENNLEAESSKNTSEETVAEPEPEEPKERVTVSINAVPSSDRSLVFKICTNKNTFSISKSTKSETPRESEENNNSQASTSETRWNHCFKDSEQDGSGKGNVSDTDSERLAVVDSNDSEAENKAEEEDDQEEEEEQNVPSGEKSNDPEKQEEAMETNNVAAEPMEVEEEKVEGDGIALAGPEIPIIDVNVEGILETMEIEDLLKKCISAASPTCVFCNHARLVAVNGKQLGLHMLAEHRFQPQHPAIIIQLDQFVTKVKNCLAELESCFFNLDSYDSKKSGKFNVPDTRVYECFHCRFSSSVHKELYLHNRKMHQKSIILCVMCKSTFHSYSELLCHLCPGIYAANRDIRYRCCLCPVSNLPSAFRLMVHLRKVHHACDVCLESTGNQQRLSNHVWKHKLHHLCYRCGISYRNKPDITKHLFWKHGTESVLCKKCLQKKWPHVYHFCVPPTAFTCEECNTTFSKAVALKVHKRLHSNELPYSCSECPERFVSRKLLQKHEDAHRAPPSPPVEVVAPIAKSPQDKDISSDSKIVKDETDGKNVESAGEEKKDKEIKEPVKKVDVLDLPPLNLSSESDSESDQETVEKKNECEQVINELPKLVTESTEEEPLIREADNLMDVERDEEEKKQEARIMDGIWDNFKSYTASLKSDKQKVNSETEADLEFLKSVIMAEHDYWVVYTESNPEVNGEAVEKTDGLNNEVVQSPVQNKETPAVESLESPKKKLKSPKKSKQQSGSSSSDSSSDDSSSCTCGTNCSCSSSSSNSSSSSSSSSDSDSSDTESSPKKAPSRKDRKKDGSKKAANCSSESEPKNENGEVQEGVVDIVQISPVKVIAAPRESDLETDETLTDEDFYDEHPQLLALKMLAEKRNQQLMLLASVAEDQPVSPAEPLNNGISESANELQDLNINEKPVSTKGRKKVKNKKRKKNYRQGKVKNQAKSPVESIKLNIPKAYYHNKTPASVSQVMTPPTSAGFYATSTPKVQPMKLVNQNVTLNTPENENKRSSKRKRIPKRFYGDSSDEENDKQVPKWRKVEPSFVIRQPAPPIVQQPMPSIIPTVAPPAPSPVIYYQPPAAEVEASGSDTDEAADSSSDSDSEPETPQITAPLPPLRIHPPHPTERANLYCYCQCPYDEVSEMIACDASDCRIEWFHFECVGIMVPPKGKWFCPDCRRRLGLPQTSDEIAN